MFKNKKYVQIAIGALVVTLTLGLVALAPINPASAATTEGDGFNHGRGPGPGGEEALAEALGISVEELQAAHETVQTEMLEQAVAEGKLTQEQADQLKTRGTWGHRGQLAQMKGVVESYLADALGISVEDLQAARESVKTEGLQQALEDGKITEEQVAIMEARQALQNYITKGEMVSKALGITVEELEAAREDGQRLPDLLEELGIDQEDFEANLQTIHEETLQQAVRDGVITQEQADQMLENNFQGRRGPGGRGFPGGKEGFERPEGSPHFPGCPGNGESDETNL